MIKFEAIVAPLPDRTAAWAEFSNAHLMRHDHTPLAPTAITASLAIVGDIKVGNVQQSPCKIERTARHCSLDGQDDFHFIQVHSGKGSFVIGDAPYEVGSGQVAMVDMSVPHSSAWLKSSCVTDAVIPRAEFIARFGSNERLLRQVVNLRSPLGLMAHRMFADLATHASEIPSHLSVASISVALDYLALAMSREFKELPSARSEALTRIKAVVATLLPDPNLTPASICKLAAVSPRYANMLFSESGTTLEQYVITQRLEKCKSSLAEPANANRPISDICFRWGFTNSSHFARRFRDAYGMTPSEWRETALSQRIARD